MQFHIEVTSLTACEWGCVPAYAVSLETVMSAGVLGRLDAEMASALPGLNRTAWILYDNFMGLVRNG